MTDTTNTATNTAAQPTKSAEKLTLPSPAKLNLFLHITGQRADGYHSLQTMFQFLDYYDTLHFQVNPSHCLTLNPPLTGVATEDNLIIKAARLLQQHTGCYLGADIEIEKRLPMGGGLGGGSSNAATTLLALNKLWQLNLSLNTLAELGLQLGADVPVFIHGQAAFAEGIGEILTPVPELDQPWYLVVCPQVNVNTGKIFSHKGLTRDSDPINMRTALRQERNDCQQIVTMLYPEIGNTLNLLSNYSLAKMTGTGACCFISFSSEAEASRVSDQLPAEYKAFVAKGLNLSPTHKVLFRPS